jgi:nicotinate (nicotinamide) nucleotide adenylyltransferase
LKTALVFGGAFNPPTLAHVTLAEYAMKETGSDCVIFVPTKNSYIEVTQHKNFAFSNDMRLEMLKKLQETRPWMLVSDYEITSPRQPRTYETLCHLRDEGYACKLLFGSDKLGELETVWKYVHEIATEFGMVCLSRSEDNPGEMIENDPYLRTLKPYIQVIEAPEVTKHMSSTQVRNELTEIMERLARIRTIIPQELTGLILNYLTMEDKQ